MSLIDFILNLAALLLWISWRHLPYDLANRIRPATLTGTLRRAEPAHVKRWHFLAALGLLLVLRGLFYWWVGPALSWTPGIKLGAIAISFRSDFFWRMLDYSIASFIHTLFAFYLWLLLLSLLNAGHSDANPCQRFVAIMLGAVHRWPRAAKAALPFFTAALAWLAVGPLLEFWLIVPRASSWIHRAEQAALLGAAVYLVWKFLIGAVLALHLVNSYVYLGSHPLWSYVEATARRLLTPLSRLSLRLGRMDFAPLVGIVLVFIIAGLLENGLHRVIPGVRLQLDIPGLTDLYRRISG